MEARDNVGLILTTGELIGTPTEILAGELRKYIDRIG